MRRNAESIHELDLVRKAAEHLRGVGWSVQEEPLVGHMRPDLIAESPGGQKVFVIEFKVGTSPSVHFGALAQLSQYREAVEADKQGDVTPVLVTNAAIHEQVQHAADDLGIQVFSATAESLPDTLFSGLQPLVE